MDTEPYKEFLSVADMARTLGVYRTTIYNYMKDINHPLPSIRISRSKILVKKSDFDNWLENFKTKGGDK